MSISFNKKVPKYVLLTCIWVALAIICVYCYPRHVYTFKYHYEVGKPWSYESLIADEDFPIYKTETQLKREQTEVLRSYTPYYKVDEALVDQQWEAIRRLPAAASLSARGTEYLRSSLEKVYQQGVLAASEVEHLQKEGYTKIALLNDQRVARTVTVKECYTPRSAYAAIMDNAPLLSENALRKLELDKYLIPNLLYDTITSNQVRKDILAMVAPTQGMVESGVKIVDKGEIVTDEIAQKLASLRITYQDKQIDHKQFVNALVGNIFLVLIFLALLIVYLAVFRRKVFEDVRNTFFFASLIAVIILLTYITLRFTGLSIYIVPFAWIPILVRVFYDSRTAFMVHLTAVLLASFMVVNTLEFLLVQVAIGFVTISSLQEMTQRAQLVRTAGMVFPTSALVYTAFILATTGDWGMIETKLYFYFCINALFITFAYALIYFCEKGFGFVSAITLVELTNANSSLLMEFAGKAPGSFQHSLQVSDLATEAARKIGAQVLLVRTGALYHDIGKMAAPQNFTENQQDGYNPLKEMSYIEAAQTIIGHVTDGVRIAKKHNLPDVVVRFIRTHHGTSKARYFYNSYCNEHPGETVDAALFTYPGPRPSSKEGAIVMMADAVEARSRSLSIYTEESISQMVEQMIDAQIADGQFKDTNLSFKDVEDIKAVFIEKLININHHRISYPDLK